jgi:hypothetical protein
VPDNEVAVPAVRLTSAATKEKQHYMKINEKIKSRVGAIIFS